MPARALELPKPLTQPIDTQPWPQALRDSIAEPVHFVALTRTRVDTGFWLYRPRLWVWVGGRGLTLWAWGYAPYQRTYDKARLLGSFYNHVTGAVALADDDRKVFQTLTLPPDTGYQLLAQIYNGSPPPGSSPATPRIAPANPALLDMTQQGRPDAQIHN